MRHVVATIVQERVNPFEFAVACEIFGLRRPADDIDWYDFRLCASRRQITAKGGWRVTTEFGLEAIDAADTVVVPNACCNEPGGDDPAVLDALGAAHERGARMIALCSGAFTLARAGILDGRRATTHWMYAEQLQTCFPKVDLAPNVLFVDDGDVLTSAGTGAGIDLALHVVRRDHGAEVARSVARRMVAPPHRGGGQAQYIDPPHEPRVSEGEISMTLDWVRERLDQPLTVADMADHASMSRRTFVRRFKEATGTTPHRWLTNQRLHLAQELLESSDLLVDLVADRAGFGTGANLRQHFRREFHTTPSRYRDQFNDAA